MVGDGGTTNGDGERMQTVGGCDSGGTLECGEQTGAKTEARGCGGSSGGTLELGERMRMWGLGEP